MINQFLCGLVRALLSLRYRITVTGAERVVPTGRPGILFLPNHPALVDPLIVMSHLYSRFHLRPLADQDQVGRPVIRWVASQINVIPIPDPSVYGDAGRRGVEEGIERCVETLKAGDNILLYPSGHIQHHRHEDLAGASAVETILAAVPDVRIVLVRTRGLWGSSFGRAAGHAPLLGKVLKKAMLALLANGIFFSPRRPVSVEVAEPTDLPRGGGRAALNRYLEVFYNEGALPARHIPYTLWERGGAHDLPEPAGGAGATDVAEVPAATRKQVIDHLHELTGCTVIQPEHSLARDLNLDSLALVDLGLWIEAEFGFPVDPAAGLETVGDVMLAARGQAAAAITAELKPVPERWSTPAQVGPGIPEGDTLAAAFLRRAALEPGRVVLADQTGGGKTYRDVLTTILALKPQVEKMPGDYVGIMLPASAGAGVLYLTVLLSGKIPVMVNWTVGVRNMTHSLDVLGVKVVLTAGRVVARIESQSGSLGELKSRFILVEELAHGIGVTRKVRAWLGARIGGRRILLAVPMKATAVVLFTSGSESVPKAVPLTHANLLANLRDFCRVFHFTPADRLIGILPPFHSFGLTCTMLLPLCGGVPVVYHPNPTEGAMLARLIEAYRVTLLVGTPTFLNGVLRAVKGTELDSLRAVISGAEKCPSQMFDLVARCWPHIKVIEGYGITECSPVVAANDEAAPQSGTIGRVLPFVEHVILDVETGQRAAPGRTGMLLVRGPSIFGGYLNYEGPSPFEVFEGKPWFRTGDLVTPREDGVLVFAGRLKRFVKLGGEMISLPAIEEVLAKHYVTPADEEPVLAVEATSTELNPELVLFTIRELNREEVNNRIKEAGLSGLHNIRVIRNIDKIPVLGTGKTDYRALRDAGPQCI